MLVELEEESFSMILCPDKLYKTQVKAVTDGEVI